MYIYKCTFLDRPIYIMYDYTLSLACHNLRALVDVIMPIASTYKVCWHIQRMMTTDN